MARRYGRIHQALSWVRVRVYAAGLRPRSGSILYSPSLDLIYSMADQIPLMKEALRATHK
ncbi:hypothetical protein [Arthrobacter phage SWEP2]|uniref:Uncharacterized protein n=1 Tax=Arthrobacter phage SWEP2 TaxID=2945958 RepID=A0A9E7MJ79_9CAUD|nr:hypothetical protein [Arthrobacter phage SWEP2]